MTKLLKTLTVLLALSFAFNVQAQNPSSEQQDITEGKIQAGALVQALMLQNESAELVANIQFVQDMVGTSMEDTAGLLKALGEKEFFAMEEKAKLDFVIEKMKTSSSEAASADDLLQVRKSRDAIFKLNRETRELINDKSSN